VAADKDAADELREVTPLLITGSRGSNTAIAEGNLAPGLDGTLIEHVYAAGAKRREATIVLTSVPEAMAYAPALVCRDRDAVGGGDPAQLPAERWVSVELESVAFNRRYHLLTLAGQDPGWVREFFSPDLIAWLADRAPDGLSFELNERHLAIAQPGLGLEPGARDGLLAAAGELRDRLRNEALEEEADPDLFDESAEVAAVVKTIDVVAWAKPPESVGAAVERYARAARWKSAVIVNAGFWGVVLFALTLVVATLIVDIFVSFAVAVFIAVVPALFAGFGAAGIAQYVGSHRYRGGEVSVQRVAYEAWVRGYARSRKLELVDRWRWHSDHRSLPLPGFADHVLAGPIPGSNVDGWFVMLGDAAELRSTGQEIAYVANRPLASSAIVVRLERAPTDAEVAALELPDEYTVGHAGHEVVVWRPVQGNLLRTSAGSDRFRETAAKVLAPILSA
jgi:hypothetical protein